MPGRAVFVLCAVLAAAPLSCLTVGLHYPSGEVDETARRIVEDIRGQGATGNPGENGPRSRGAQQAGDQGRYVPGIANTGNRGTVLSDPAIEALRGKLKQRARALFRFFQAGATGEGNEGLIVLREVSPLPVKDRAILNRLVEEENTDRKVLYRKVARALGVKQKYLRRVQKAFARQWQHTSRPGWWVQDASGNWHER